LSGLDRIREAAQKDKGLRFTSLMHHITVDLLRESYKDLKRDAAPGLDDVTWRQYGEQLEERLPGLHARVQSGRYRAMPSKRVWLTKSDGRQRPVGIAVLEDKIVQQAAVMVLSQIYEETFIGFSYGFRPNRSPHHALDAVWVGITQRKVNWVLDADIRGFFDAIDHEWLMKFLEHRIADPGLLLLIRKWLKAGVSEAGQWSMTKVGTPQGAVISPVLSNLFLHYVFDKWMERKYPRNPWARYADDGVTHCRTRTEAEGLLEQLHVRFRECGLELHPDKTRIVYCKDDDRRGDYPEIKFDFLGYTFRPRRSKNRYGKFFINFTPGTSNKAAKAMRYKIRNWRIHLKPDKSIEDLARMFNPVIRGWINYYGRFYKSALYPVLRHMNSALIHWVRRKYKKLSCHRRRAEHWLGRIARREPQLFAHWQMGILPSVG